MNEERMFELVSHAASRETAGTDFEFNGKKGKKVLAPAQQESVIRKSIQSFMFDYSQKNKENKDLRIQAFMGSSDIPQLTKDVFNVFNKVPEYDLLWQEAYKGIRLMKGQLSWEIADIESAAVFELIPEGGKVKFYKYTGTKVTVEVQKYGMGIGITWETIHGRKLHKFIEQMEFTRSELYTLWANIHYGLLATAALSNAVGWQGAVGESHLQRDIQTINFGYETIGENTKDSGYGDTANAPILIYASPKLKSRILQAIRATAANVINTTTTVTSPGRVVEYNVKPKFTWNANIPAGKALMVLPGNKIQNSAYINELALSKQEIESLNELRTYWTVFGATVADVDQTAELTFG